MPVSPDKAFMRSLLLAQDRPAEAARCAERIVTDIAVVAKRIFIPAAGFSLVNESTTQAEFQCSFAAPAVEVAVKTEFGRNIRFVKGHEERIMTLDCSASCISTKYRAAAEADRSVQLALKVAGGIIGLFAGLWARYTIGVIGDEVFELRLRPGAILLLVFAGAALGTWLGKLVGDAYTDRKQRRLEQDPQFLSATEAWEKFVAETTAVLDAAAAHAKGLAVPYSMPGA